MRRVGNLILNNLASMFTIKKFSVVIMIYFFLNLITKELFESKINTFNDLMKFSFYGSDNLTDMPIVVMTWIAVQIILIYIVLDFIHNELNTRVRLIILRIESKKMWINSIFIAVFLCCFLYFALGLIILGLLNYNLVKSSLDLVYSLKLLLLLTLSSFSICLIGGLLTLFFKNQVIIFTLMVLSYYVAISIGGVFSKYMIFSQGILIKHCYYNISFQWTYYYTFLFSIIIYSILRKLLLRRDII